MVTEIHLSSIIEAVLEDFSDRAAFFVGETVSENTDSLTLKIMEDDYGDCYGKADSRGI